MLGSDYPFPLGEAHPGQLIESMHQLSSNVKARCYVLLVSVFNAKFQHILNEIIKLPRFCLGRTSHMSHILPSYAQ